MPPAPPIRAAAANYHFHTYDYVGSAAAAAGPWALSPAQPNANFWQFYSLVQDMAGLQQVGAANGVPNIALHFVGGGIGPNNLITIALSFGSNAPNAPTVVITGGIHAREWIAPEFVYLLAEYLIIHYTTAPQNRYQRAIRDLVNSRRIYILPMLNPEGNEFTVFTAGGRLWRKNRRPLPGTAANWLALVAPGGNTNPPFANAQAPPPGNLADYRVPDYDFTNHIPPNAPPNYRQTTLANGQTGVDLNRNCGTLAWGYDNPIPTVAGPVVWIGGDPVHDVYCGPGAGSEVETGNVQQALFNAFNAGNPPGLATAIDYHSYGQYILYPSETFNNGGVGPDYSTLGQVLRHLIRSQAALDYQLGSPRQLVQYDATGTITDHAAQQYHARAFTVELDPQQVPGGGGPGFQLQENQIMTVFEKNIRGALAAIAAPAAPAGPFQAQLQRLTIGLSMLQFLTWNVYGRGNQLP